MPDREAEPARSATELERENRILERRLRRLERNAQQLENYQDTNSKLLTTLLRELEEEREKSRRLLLNVLPQRIADRLSAGEATIADRHDDVTVLFADFVGFTEISATLPPADLVEDLNSIFRAFDATCDAAGVEKIKTVGDAYLAVGGIAGQAADGARAIADTALRMVGILGADGDRHASWRIRIGLSVGPLIAGVVGASKFAYDVWGDTVNVASRLQSTSEPNRIHVSSGLARHLESDYELEPRGSVELKGVGAAETYFLLGRRG